MEQLRDYATSYHSVILDDKYDGGFDLPHHVVLYITPIQPWIEVVNTINYQFGKKFDDIMHAYDFPSNLPFMYMITQFYIF